MGYLRRQKGIGDERFVSGRSVCEIIGASSRLRLIHRDVSLVRMFPDFHLGADRNAEKRRGNGIWSWL